MGALGNDGNASMPEEVKRPNPWMMMMMMHSYFFLFIDFFAAILADVLGNDARALPLPVGKEHFFNDNLQ